MGKTNKIEALGATRFEDFLDTIDNIKWQRITDDTPQGLALQLAQIDYKAQDLRGREISIELKTEAENRWGNFFIELFQGVYPCFDNGWIQNIEADLLAYLFLDSGDLYLLNVGELRDWLFGSGAFTKYQIKAQQKYTTNMTSYGLCVPISHAEANMEGFQRFKV
jgi:hypothetical protein